MSDIKDLRSVISADEARRKTNKVNSEEDEDTKRKRLAYRLELNRRIKQAINGGHYSLQLAPKDTEMVEFLEDELAKNGFKVEKGRTPIISWGEDF